MKHIDYSISTILYAALVSTSNIYAGCYFGEMSIQSYVKMADGFMTCSWYELPADLQKYFILMIMNAQRPIHNHGFNLIVLNLETFLDVNTHRTPSQFYIQTKGHAFSSNIIYFQMIRNVFTYYMVFKAITSD